MGWLSKARVGQQERGRSRLSEACPERSRRVPLGARFDNPRRRSGNRLPPPQPCHPERRNQFARELISGVEGPRACLHNPRHIKAFSLNTAENSHPGLCSYNRARGPSTAHDLSKAKDHASLRMTVQGVARASETCTVEEPRFSDALSIYRNRSYAPEAAKDSGNPSEGRSPTILRVSRLTVMTCPIKRRM